MRTRLVTLVMVTGLALAPLSALACQLECRRAAGTSSAAHGSAHAGCHEPSGTTRIVLGHVSHECDHVAVMSPTERIPAKVGSALDRSTLAVTLMAVVEDQREHVLISASPPRSLSSLASSVSAPLRI